VKPRPYYDEGDITIYHGDCRELLPQLKLPTPDLLILDPPFLERAEIAQAIPPAYTEHIGGYLLAAVQKVAA
jgi:predicted methyltransferase